jgi:GT2 family glycosyltransferase
LKETQRPVSVVLLTWNGLEYTKACLDSIRLKTSFNRYDIVVADNGSTDGTVEYLQAQSDVKTVYNDANLGFAKGSNVAIAQTDPQSDVILLNNDTEIVQPDWISALQRVAHSADDIGMVGCRLIRPDGMLQHMGAYLPVDTFAGEQIGACERDINQFPGNHDVESVVFACVYLKRATLEAVGLLDEEYFSYFEDTDYCLRVKERGLRVVCCGDVRVVHHEHVSTRVNGVSQNKMFTAGQAVFRRKWEAKLVAERYTRKIGWNSLMNFPTGYAISSRELATALDRNGVHVAYQYVYGPGTLFPPEEPEKSETRGADMIRARPLDAERPQVVYGQGDIFYRHFGAYKIGFTMLETDGIPAEWARQANLMDEVWCPSTFNAKTFRDSGVTRPIHVIPLGIDPAYFNPRIHSSRVSDRYTFLSVFEWGERKAPELLLRAFNEEFSSTEPVVLVCKMLNADTSVNVHDEIRRLVLNPGGGQIHVTLNHVVPSYQLGVLYRSADCFVLTTRGEGWGMPILEAMACGLPVIATDWSAQCDFMNAGNAYPLAVERLVPAVAKCPYYNGFRWAQPSYWDLRRQMRHVYENAGEARAVGERASREVLSRWTWDNAALKMIERLDALGRRSGMPVATEVQR